MHLFKLLDIFFNLWKNYIYIYIYIKKNDDGPKVNSTLYKRMVGSFMYLTATRPDLMYDVSLISRFMESPKDSHWKVEKIIRRYVAGTLGYGL